jgi:hypothetical protein
MQEPSDEDLGGAYGWNRGDRRKQELNKDDEELLQIVELALPEILKYLDDDS